MIAYKRFELLFKAFSVQCVVSLVGHLARSMQITKITPLKDDKMHLLLTLSSVISTTSFLV